MLGEESHWTNMSQETMSPDRMFDDIIQNILDEEAEREVEDRTMNSTRNSELHNEVNVTTSSNVRSMMQNNSLNNITYTDGLRQNLTNQIRTEQVQQSSQNMAQEEDALADSQRSNISLLHDVDIEGQIITEFYMQPATTDYETLNTEDFKLGETSEEVMTVEESTAHSLELNKPSSQNNQNYTQFLNEDVPDYFNFDECQMKEENSPMEQENTTPNIDGSEGCIAINDSYLQNNIFSNKVTKFNSNFGTINIAIANQMQTVSKAISTPGVCETVLALEQTYADNFSVKTLKSEIDSTIDADCTSSSTADYFQEDTQFSNVTDYTAIPSTSYGTSCLTSQSRSSTATKLSTSRKRGRPSVKPPAPCQELLERLPPEEQKKIIQRYKNNEASRESRRKRKEQERSDEIKRDELMHRNEALTKKKRKVDEHLQRLNEEFLRIFK